MPELIPSTEKHCTVYSDRFTVKMAEITAKMAMRTNTLYMYKNLLKVARALPEPKREQSLRTIRADFKSGAIEMDSDRVEEMLKKAASTLGKRRSQAPEYI